MPLQGLNESRMLGVLFLQRQLALGGHMSELGRKFISSVFRLINCWSCCNQGTCYDDVSVRVQVTINLSR